MQKRAGGVCAREIDFVKLSAGLVNGVDVE